MSDETRAEALKTRCEYRGPGVVRPCADPPHKVCVRIQGLLAALLAEVRQEGREGHHEPLGSWTKCKRCTQFFADDQEASRNIAERDAELARAQEEIARLRRTLP